MSTYTRIKGTKDIFGEEVKYWEYIENTAKKLFKIYGYKEIRTPLIEKTDLFSRGIGQETDIVQKEMYTFDDKKGRSLTLRPEGTASVARAYIENSLITFGSPQKLFYMGPMFRYEKPQAGRYREFYQIGAEIFGTDHPLADAELITFVYDFFNKLKLSNFKVKINNIGTFESREKYKEVLKTYYQPLLPNLCEDCQRRFNTNIMRLLDCKIDVEAAKNAPPILDYLDEESHEHFNNLQKYLKAYNVPYQVDPKIVRGLDYYTKTAFEVEHSDLGEQAVIAGGGRYDDLVEQLEGPKTPGVGFAIGIERVIEALKRENVEVESESKIDVYIAFQGEKGEMAAVTLTKELRKKGINTFLNISKRNLSGQFKHANRLNAKYVVVLGDEEISRDIVTIKNMKSGEQTQIERNWVAEIIVEKLREE
ncbi:histidyl-tRNA synthetase [Petrotoga sp. HWH.PT.55.6.1]|uniref:histidine--tRNA ligase n=1 Tax=unclassified Petrotoga TaxID=2620614 RepID=UPI000CA08520|nr:MULTISPECIES: histidine--tRNA ligase [unclassified Petrotoga]PNR91064.1 histidyl-tRNA synthetase [Petrotoga sp. HWHPT.55.6.3]RPD36431.1 histidyl-tRNA synthetase [Petrotoga sp. HWH.PT.55.6.1]